MVKLRQDRWKAQDGSNRSKLKVVGQMIRFDGSTWKERSEKWLKFLKGELKKFSL
ncbi:hypothetical protein LEP1GSC116_1266 [Leptospira interrogans serovar Icterohaemorrhagiae str. Verdun HP]|uniref:Uncharacterized protein n=1 Tax=Leptospira interrogans serovar Icterohaemorrhagiae str. Verdun HP TaxID=1049910 RepID=M6R9C7_LEPIR|nr:hypothetical protein LEP1GSC116_1266 [Leptospira interrogans serovar Icterohaemorrhagiae str. Verdun HP]